MKIKKCKTCGTTVEILKDGGIQCCGTAMEEEKPNTVECAVEKHIPTYERTGNTIQVKVNHVMEEPHHIAWISMVAGNKEMKTFLTAGEEATAEFPYIPGATIYAYCNLHGLWKSEVE